MSNTQKQYDREFKVLAEELSKSRDNMVALAKELDVRPALLYRWKRELASFSYRFLDRPRTGNFLIF